MFSLWFLSSRSLFEEELSFSCVFGKNVLSFSFVCQLLTFIVVSDFVGLRVLPDPPILQETGLFWM